MWNNGPSTCEESTLRHYSPWYECAVNHTWETFTNSPLAFTERLSGALKRNVAINVKVNTRTVIIINIFCLPSKWNTSHLGKFSFKNLKDTYLIRNLHRGGKTRTILKGMSKIVLPVIYFRIRCFYWNWFFNILTLRGIASLFVLAYCFLLCLKLAQNFTPSPVINTSTEGKKKRTNMYRINIIYMVLW